VNVVAITKLKIPRNAATVFSKLPGRRNLENIGISDIFEIITYKNPSIFIGMSHSKLASK
jgi:hypothetical protein